MSKSNLLKDNKELMKQWDFEKNENLNLDKITIGSGKLAWWNCEKGHKWQTSIKSRYLGYNCPYCSNKKLLIGYNDLATTNPELLKIWNYDKNRPLKPTDVKAGSHNKVWWKCEKGHEWQTSIRYISNGGGCPYCSNKKLLIGYNDLVTTNPELIEEWNYEKNKPLKPTDVKTGSHNKVWWKCEKGHEWQTSIEARCHGYKCPICSNHVLDKGYNDLESTNPELAKEWNYEKNRSLKPTDVKAGSHNKVWWKCEKGHEWQTAINQRSQGSKCPYCSNKKLLIGYNDLATTNPELVKEWNFDKNKSLKPTDIMKGSRKKVWWKCEKGHEWQASIGDRSRNHNCPYCNEENQTSLPERIVYYYIKKFYPTAIHNYIPSKFNKRELDIYIPELSVAIEYDGSYFHEKYEKDLQKDKLCKKNNIKLYRIRESKLANTKYKSDSIKIVLEDNSYKSLENAINYILDDLKIRHTSINIVSELNEIYKFINFTDKEDSLLEYNPKLVSEWNYEKNGNLRPEHVKKHSGKKVWWRCEKGHEWQAEINNRTKGNRCPYCTNRKFKKGYNDLATTNPELVKEWNYEKNGNLRPEHIKNNATTKVWWKCEKGHEWITSVNYRSKTNSNCPKCKDKIL